MNPLFIIYIYLALVDIEEKRTHAAKSSSGESLIVDKGRWVECSLPTLQANCFARIILRIQKYPKGLPRHSITTLFKKLLPRYNHGSCSEQTDYCMTEQSDSEVLIFALGYCVSQLKSQFLLQNIRISLSVVELIATIPFALIMIHEFNYVSDTRKPNVFRLGSLTKRTWHFLGLQIWTVCPYTQASGSCNAEMTKSEILRCSRRIPAFIAHLRLPAARKCRGRGNPGRGTPSPSAAD